MISLGLGTINDTLTTNAYTRSPYGHAKVISTTAYKLTEPIQTVLAPLIIKADGIANMAVDAVESRYPYPFKAQPEEVPLTCMTVLTILIISAHSCAFEDSWR